MTERRPAVSVIICVRNGIPWIADQLDALARQAPDVFWEVIVADNGSTDGTAALVADRARGFPVELSLIDASARRGIAHARNAGVLSSRGDVLAFCDADDRVADGWVQAAWDGTRDADVVSGPIHELKEPCDPHSPVFRPALLRNAIGYSIAGGNSAMRRDMFFRAGGFDESLPPYGSEDVDFSARLNRAGAQISAEPGMGLYFRATDRGPTLLRKVYMRGLSEYLYWSRNAQEFGVLTHPLHIARTAGFAGLDTLRALRRRDRARARASGRWVVASAAHAWMSLRTFGGRRLPEPRLLQMGDDAVTGRTGA